MRYKPVYCDHSDCKDRVCKDIECKTSDCSICYEQIDSKTIETLPCGHMFHRICILTWANECSHHFSCPYCKTEYHWNVLFQTCNVMMRKKRCSRKGYSWNQGRCLHHNRMFDTNAERPSLLDTISIMNTKTLKEYVVFMNIVYQLLMKNPRVELTPFFLKYLIQRICFIEQDFGVVPFEFKLENL